MDSAQTALNRQVFGTMFGMQRGTVSCGLESSFLSPLMLVTHNQPCTSCMAGNGPAHVREAEAECIDMEPNTTFIYL